MKAVINKVRNMFVSLIAILSVATIISLLVAGSADIKWMYLVAFISGGCAVGAAKELFYFSEHFENEKNHLLSWVYPNGDILIITCWGLLKYNKEPPPTKISANFEGVRWGLDNVKDLAESLIKNQNNPLLALIPEIEFSIKSNKIDDYISFGFADDVNLTFIDFNVGYLLIDIKKKNIPQSFTLKYPMPQDKPSLAAEVDFFETRFKNRRTPINVLFIEKSLIEELMMEQDQSDIPETTQS